MARGRPPTCPEAHTVKGELDGAWGSTSVLLVRQNPRAGSCCGCPQAKLQQERRRRSGWQAMLSASSWQAGSQGGWPVAGGRAWRLRYHGPGQRRGRWKQGKGPPHAPSGSLIPQEGYLSLSPCTKESPSPGFKVCSGLHSLCNFQVVLWNSTCPLSEVGA